MEAGTGAETPDDDEQDFDDLAERPADTGFDLAWARIVDERVLRIVAGIGLAVAVLVWPGRSDRILVALFGAVIVLVSVTTAWSALSASPRRRLDAAAGVVGVGVGGVLLAMPDRSVQFVGRVMALVLVVVALRALVVDLRARSTSEVDLGWPTARTLAALLVAALIARYPNELFASATALVAAGWAALGVLLLVREVDGDRSGETMSPGALLVEWLDERAKSTVDRRQLYAKILYEGPEARTRVARYATLMALASIIAAMGVITDSTAVVIGAMLIAPLMTPLMAVAISIVMGWPNRLGRSATIAIGGVALAILIGILLGSVAPASIDPATNGQILARSSPTILDLMTAVAAGAAGAYGLSRPDVSDSLPGVAIAISLVPPLSVVGISWSQGAWAEGNGALLLFVTNALAIVVVGGITFVLTGMTPLRRVAEHQYRVRTASASIAALLAMVIGALSLNGAQIAANAVEIGSALSVAEDWIDAAPEHDLVEVRLDGDLVTAVIVGPPTDPPTAADLRVGLVDRLGADVVVDVRLLVQRRDIAGAD
ncbi:MAG: DUF389 domain-containing protein [Actinomycetota bacterium]